MRDFLSFDYINSINNIKYKITTLLLRFSFRSSKPENNINAGWFCYQLGHSTKFVIYCDNDNK